MPMRNESAAPSRESFNLVIGGGRTYTKEATLAWARLALRPSRSLGIGEALGMPQSRQLPMMPQIGHPESYYAKASQTADRMGDRHAHEANKVGQYVTLAMDPHLTWEEKLKYFQHAVKRHCNPPPYPDDEVWMFYQQLADLVRQYCGHEALRLASLEDDLYAARL